MIAIESLPYLFVHLIPVLLVLALAWTLVRAVGVRVVWREDE